MKPPFDSEKSEHERDAARRSWPTCRATNKPVVRERFQLLVDCPDEGAQRKLYERLVADGWRLRVLTI